MPQFMNYDAKKKLKTLLSESESDFNSASINSDIFFIFSLYLHSSK